MTFQMQGRGAYIFVSHSHLDLEKVREIRNYLETKGANPLLFFLKCLSDDDARLPELISDEIKARDFFILCDSPNAKASTYVPDEVALVKSLDGKLMETINLSQDIRPQLYKLDRLLKRATVFMSYAQLDHEIAERISLALEKHDYAVWQPSGLQPSDALRDHICLAIDDALAQGFVLVLLSPESIKSKYVISEADYALQLAARSQRCNVVPVIVAPLAVESLPPELRLIQFFDLTTGPFDQRVDDLIRILKTREIVDCNKKPNA